MIVKFKIIMVINLMLIVLLSTSCSSTVKDAAASNTGGGKITLRCVVPYDDGRNTEAFKNFTSDIKRILPDYNIYLSFVRGDSKAYETKIKVLLSSDNPPDVLFSGDGSFTEELNSVKAIAAVDKNLEKDNFWDLVIPSAKLSTNNGHIYAVPFDDVSYGIMEINTELFSKNNVKIPENFDELKAAVKEFKTKGITPIAIAGKDGEAVYRMLEDFASTIDTDITAKIIDGKETFSGNTFRQAAEALDELMKMGAFGEKAETLTDKDAANLFYTGNAAIYCTSSRDLNISYEKLDGKSALLFYPSLGKIKQEKYEKALSGGVKKDCGLLISASTKYPKEAVKLAIEMSKYYNKFLYEKENNSGTIYIPDKMVWKPIENIPVSMKELMTDARDSDNVNSGLFENNVSFNKAKSVKEDSAAFMTGYLSVDNYLKEMDNGMKLK